MHLFADYHTHTIHSHGRGTVEENIRAAWARGLERVAITDHGPANRFGVGVADLAVFGRIRREAKEASVHYPDLEVLVGVEANIVGLDGELDVPDVVLKELDIVLVGLHKWVRPLSPAAALCIGVQNALGRYSDAAASLARRVNTRMVVEAVKRHPIDIITHPGLYVDIDTATLARACADAGTAMEISASHDHTTPEYVRIAHAEGVQFVISSDAHEPARVGDFAKGVAIAEAASLSAEHIRNARRAQRAPLLV